jgi:hypothetical protein
MGSSAETAKKKISLLPPRRATARAAEGPLKIRTTPKHNKRFALLHHHAPAQHFSVFCADFSAHITISTTNKRKDGERILFFFSSPSLKEEGKKTFFFFFKNLSFFFHRVVQRARL